jgi:hypothetical protein
MKDEFPKPRVAFELKPNRSSASRSCQGRERKIQIAAEPLANLDQLIAPAIQPTNSPMLIRCGGDPALHTLLHSAAKFSEVRASSATGLSISMIT